MCEVEEGGLSNWRAGKGEVNLRRALLPCCCVGPFFLVPDIDRLPARSQKLFYSFSDEKRSSILLPAGCLFSEVDLNQIWHCSLGY